MMIMSLMEAVDMEIHSLENKKSLYIYIYARLLLCVGKLSKSCLCYVNFALGGIWNFW